MQFSAVKPCHAEAEVTVKPKAHAFAKRECDICGENYRPDGSENQAWFCPTCAGNFDAALAANYEIPLWG